MTCLSSVLIVGGGIAGLSCAIMLSKSGAKVTLIEVSDGTAAGASIAINNRAVDALETIGVLDAVVNSGTAFDSKTSIFSHFFNEHGHALPLPAPPGRPDDLLPASIQIFRPVLTEILTQKATSLGVHIRRNCSFVEIDNHPASVRVRFNDDAEAEFDLLVAADGIHSSIRSSLFQGRYTPSFTGTTALRWMYSGKLKGEPGFYSHSDGQTLVVNNQLPNDYQYFVTGIQGPLRHIDQLEANKLVHEILSRFNADRIVDMKHRLLPEHTILVSPFSWILTPKPWFIKRVVLVGDAAHATTANLSYGAGLALEDAVVLSEELKQGENIPSSLTAYLERRFERVKMVVETSVELMELARLRAPQSKSAQLRFQAYSELMEPF